MPPPLAIVIILTFIFFDRLAKCQFTFFTTLYMFPMMSQYLAHEFWRSSINSQDLPVLGFGICVPELFNKYVAPTKVKIQASAYLFLYNLVESQKAILIVVILSNIDTVPFSLWKTQTYKKNFEFIRIDVVLLVQCSFVSFYKVFFFQVG